MFNFVVKKLFLSWCALGLLFLMVTSASAQNVVTEQAWFEDRSAKMSIDEVQGQSFSPFTGLLSKGYGSSAIWIRLKIDPSLDVSNTAGHLMLRIRPVYLDDLELFDPLDRSPEGHWSSRSTGDLHDPRLDAERTLNFNLRLKRSDEPRYLWVRLSSTSTRHAQFMVMSQSSMFKEDQQQSLIFGLLQGLSFAVLIVGLILLVATPERLIVLFTLKQAFAFVNGFFLIGYVRALLPSGLSISWVNLGTSWGVLLGTAASLVFEYLMVQSFRPPAWVAWILRLLLGVQVLAGVLFTCGYMSQALQLNMMQVFYSPFVLLFAVYKGGVWRGRYQEDSTAISRRAILGYYTFLVFVNLLAASQALGIGFVEWTELSVYINVGHGISTGLVMLTLLKGRANVLERQKQSMTKQLEFSQLETKMERAYRSDQEKLFLMLAHELKTPLATIRMNLRPETPHVDAIKRAVLDMSGVVERSVQSWSLVDAKIVLQIVACDVQSLLQQVLRGHVAADRVVLSCSASPHALLDVQIVKIVLNNLLDNASKYSPEGSPITVSCGQQARHCRRGFVICIDNEPGPAGWPDADHVFEKYYRSPNARRLTGSGLGLFLVAGFVKTLGGEISYTPTATHVQFELWLPDRS